jgi:hypothetical protein
LIEGFFSWYKNVTGGNVAEKLKLGPAFVDDLHTAVTSEIGQFQEDLKKVRERQEDGRKKKKKGLQWDLKKVVGKPGLYQLCRGVFWHPLIGLLVNAKLVEPEVMFMVNDHYDTHAPTDLFSKDTK